MTSQQATLKQLATRQDAEASQPFALGNLWGNLRVGAWRFRDVFRTDERFLAVVRCSSAPPVRQVNPSKRRLFERVLLGTPPKVVAIEGQRSLSSVTGAMQECLRSMGLSARSSQVPMLLTMAASAWHRPERAAIPGRLSELQFEGEAHFVVSVTRPDLRFPVALSLAETEVLRGLLAGDTYAQISGARATSQRTVANQLATAFKKLGVSGRRATIERLIQHQVLQG
jgi:DNA-binding CsgD family transcriptional regulator